MTKFERIGIEYQLDSQTKEEALKRFHTSCSICCNRGIRIDCDRCAIPFVHTSTVAAFEALEGR